MYLWKASQIKEAIERVEMECAEMVKRHERPEEIEKKREGLNTLRRWLEKAEENEARMNGIKTVAVNQSRGN